MATPFIPQWSDAHTIRNEGAGVCVIVRRSNHDRPRYSMECGFLVSEEQKFGRYRVIRLNDPSIADVIAECWADGEKWIEEQTKKPIAKTGKAATR